MNKEIQHACLANRELALGISKLSNYVGCLEDRPNDTYYRHLLTKTICHVETALEILRPLQGSAKNE